MTPRSSDRFRTHHRSDTAFRTAIEAHPAERRSKKPMMSMLWEIAALYWSTSGTLALVAQKLYMYRLAPKRRVTARTTGQIARNGAVRMLEPLGTRRRYATAVTRDRRH